MSEAVVNTGAEQAAPKPKRPKPKSMIMIGEQTAALFENSRLAKERGEKVGWSASIFPQEIPETLGLNILYPENHAAGIAARHQADSFLQECEGPLGYSNDLCAYAKVNLAYAAVLNGESEIELPDGGKMVKPDFLLLTNNICNQLTKWYENLARQMNIPTPATTPGTMSPRAVCAMSVPKSTNSSRICALLQERPGARSDFET